jgi:hypothetical protein
MSLATQIEDDGAYFVSMTDEMAVDAIYTIYSTNVAHDVSVILDQVKNYNQIAEGRTILDSALAYVNLPFEPSVYDTLTIGSDVYKVDDYQQSHKLFELSLSKNNRPTNHHTKGRFR